MAFIIASNLTRLRNRITNKETRLAKLYTIYENFDEVKEYRFDSGEGSQRTEFRNISEVDTAINKLEREIDSLYRKINGTNLANLNLRRRSRGRIF